MAVFRGFCRMIKTALFALVVCFVSFNAFADCKYGLYEGTACVQDTAVECAPGCYCPGGQGNISSNQSQSSLIGSCTAATAGSSIAGGAVRCPSGTNSDSGAYSIEQCYSTYSSNTPQFYAETTTDTTEFRFIISAKGTFYIDCDVNNVGGLTNVQRKKKYVKTTPDPIEIACFYNQSGKHYKIGISGENVSEYYDNDTWDYAGPTIGFGVATGYVYDTDVDEQGYGGYGWDATYKSTTTTPHNLYRISGSLGKVFPTLGTTDLVKQQPSFLGTFSGCVNLIGSLPTDLFTGDCVYNSTTNRCSSGKGIYGYARPEMYMDLFRDCTSLSGIIPQNRFFGYLTQASHRLFFRTFENCSNLTGGLSENWFSQLNFDYEPYPYVGTFKRAFYGCSGLQGNIPTHFFGSNVREVGCEADSDATFHSTFYGCTGLTGKIPYELFEGIDDFLKSNDNGSSDHDSDYFCSGDGIDFNTFGNTSMATQCDDDEYQYISGLESMFGNRGVICKKCPSGTYGTGGKNITSCLSDEELERMFIGTYDGSCASNPNICIRAAGKFHINWGNGKITDIDKTDTTSTCYDNEIDPTGGATEYYHDQMYQIKIYRTDADGLPKGYSADSRVIYFSDPECYTAIDGSIGYVFPTLSSVSVSGASKQPSFKEVFEDFGITEVSEGLFDGISGTPVPHMFNSTFESCDNLTTVSGQLFPSFTNNTVSNAKNMFEETFYDCDNLEDIPSNLFAGIKGQPADYMFYSTFNSCDSLEIIPRGLFSSLTGTPKQSTFAETFRDSGVTTVPYNLFNSLSGSINNISNPFNATFESTSLDTFKYYDGRSEYEDAPWISPEFFGNLNSTEYESGPMDDVFDRTDVATNCSDYTGYEQYFTGFESDFDGHVSCIKSANCASDKMHYNGGCIDPDFTLTTTSDTSEFAFHITASGTWYVDWGDGTVEQIKRSDYSDVFDESNRYYHEYDTDDTYVIKMKGLATDYSGNDQIAAINFSNAGYEDYIASISGSLGKMFPTIDENNSPSFYAVFNDAENLVGELPSDLFSEVTTCRDYMFQGAFTNSEITKIPSGLFSSITGGCQSMFEETFEYCSKLTTIEQNAFPRLQYCGDRMYAYTFDSCPKLTSIPSDLFENQQGGCMEMFENTFSSSGLTSIPEELFASINYTGEAMFDSTFAHTKITEVPSNLFPNIEWTDTYLFGSMFAYCENLTTIPADLFAHFDDSMPSDSAFNNMFKADTNLEFFKYPDGTKVSYIPSTFFGGLEESGYTGGNNVAKSMFGDNTTYQSRENGVLVTKSNNTKILESCPSGTQIFNSVFKNEYAPKVSCIPISSYTVQYDINYSGGTNPADATYTVGGNAITLPAPTRTGYTLDGWYTLSTGGTKISNPYTPDSDITLYAHWTLSSCPENAHIEGSECVCNEGYSGSPCSPITYNIRYEGMEDATFGTNHPTTATYDTLFTVDNPTKTGYKFTGWSIYLLLGTAPESVAYNVNGGTDGVSITAVPGEEATFIYYVENLIQFKNLRKTNSSTVKLTAKWTKQCGAGYDVINNNCVCNAPKIEENGVCHDVCPTGYSYKNTTAPAILPTIEATNSRYKSLAYPSGGSSSNVEDMSNGYYNIVWESGNTKGTLVGTASCTGTTGEVRYETVVPENSFEEAENSGSNCWCKPVSWTPYGEDTQNLSSDWVFFQEDGNACARECSAMCNNFFGTSRYINQRNDVFDNVKITSEDCVPNTYTVTYEINYNGGTNPADATYTVGENAITLPAPTRTGYTLDGWYTLSTGGTKISNPYTPDSDITLYAHWSSTSCQENAHKENNVCVCNTGTIEYYDSNNNKVCAEDKFQLTTKDDTDSFQFQISAAGDFIVDCGTGGNFNGTENQVGTITRSNTAAAIYTCSWNTAAAHIIRFGGEAKGYADGAAAIRFNISQDLQDENAQKISSISGSLGQIFKTLTNPTIGIGQPSFLSVFMGASNMTCSIPEHLFTDIHGEPVNNMFGQVFYGCSGLSGTDINDPNNPGMKYAIPPNLFGNISGKPARGMFANTFKGCSGLTGSIPSGLFGNISGKPADMMFDNTFEGCSGLSGSIPSGLFGNLYDEPAQSMFNMTFSDCSGLSGTDIDDPNNPGMKYAIPPNLFGNISGEPKAYMFSSTFYGCSGLTGSIPSGLFGNLFDKPKAYMFSSTFQGCSGLTGSIPSGLFGNISGEPADSMFSNTFNGCSGLTGTIPSGLFGNISGKPARVMFARTFQGCIGLTDFTDVANTTNYVPANFLSAIEDGDAANPVISMFSGTNLNNPCPADTYDVTRSQFSNAGKPWCMPCSEATNGEYPNSDRGSTSINQCYRNESCPELSECPENAPNCSYIGDTTWKVYANTTSSQEHCQIQIESCDTGYTPNNGVCEPNIYTITLVHGDNATDTGPNTIYLKYGKGYYPTLQDAQNETNYISGETELSKPQRPGYTFGGYFRLNDPVAMINITGDISYHAVGGDTIPFPFDSVTQDEIWTAKWTQDTINLLYKYNDINDVQRSGMCTYETSPFTVLGQDSSVVRPGYKFMGWKYQKVITSQ